MKDTPEVVGALAADMKDTPEVVGALAADMKDTLEVVRALAAEAVSEAIIRAVNNSESAYGLPSASDLK